MNVLIIEDESAAARRLKKLVAEIDEDIVVVDELDSIESTIKWMNENPAPNLIFLDIHLADGSSFEIFNHLNIQTPVIFTTAYDEYAIQAFKVNAIDYLLKPIKRTELEAAIRKYQKSHRSANFDYDKLVRAMQKESMNKRFLIKLGQSIRVVEMQDIAYFYTENKITFLVTKAGKRYPVDYSLEKLDEMLDQLSFFRINRQFIINIDSIEEMYSYSKSRVKVELRPACDLQTIVSTERSPHFKKWLAGE